MPNNLFRPLGHKELLILTKLLGEKLNKLPYKFNLLEEVWADENAHSRILVNLLRDKTTLHSFISFLKRRYDRRFDFDEESMVSPQITSERYRIDGLICEHNKYAIIIENKIHGAKEQSKQLSRYIEKCNSLGYSLSKIFVIYITRTQYEHASKQTWADFKDFFSNRYVDISYKEDIIDWLDEYYQEIPRKEEDLASGIYQYKAYLIQLTNNYKYKKMDPNIKNLITSSLQLEDKNGEEQLLALKANKSAIDNLSGYIDALMIEAYKKIFEEWSNKLGMEFNSLELLPHSTDDNYLKAGIILPCCENYKIAVLIEQNLQNKNIYYGFGRHHISEQLIPEVKTFCESLLVERELEGWRTNDNIWWYCWKYTTVESGYADLVALIKLVRDKMNTN